MVSNPISRSSIWRTSAGPVPSQRPRHLHSANGRAEYRAGARGLSWTAGGSRGIPPSRIGVCSRARIRCILMPRGSALRRSTTPRPRGASNDEETPGISQPALAGPCGCAPGRSAARPCSPAAAPHAQAARRDTLDGVVQIIAHVPQDARTASTLGTERQGTGVVIDDSGLILTIGYLILEAMEIQIQGAAPEPVPARHRRLRSRDRLRSGARRTAARSRPRSRLACRPRCSRASR